MSLFSRQTGVLVLSLWFATLTAPAAAAPCGNGPAGFPAFKREAAGQGISQRAIAASLNGVTYDPKIISFDRNQRVFKQSFAQFSGRMVNSFRINKGKSMLKQYAATLARVEQRFGVPGPAAGRRVPPTSPSSANGTSPRSTPKPSPSSPPSLPAGDEGGEQRMANNE